MSAEIRADRKFAPSQERTIQSVRSLQEFLQQEGHLINCTIQDIDFRTEEINWYKVNMEHTTFLGCHFAEHEEVILRSMGAFVYPRLPDLPYNPYRKQLYSWQELMEGYTPEDDQSTDYLIYNHFSRKRFNPDINEALNQRIHDHSIDDALRRLMGYNGAGDTNKKSVGIMGGHGTLRTDPFYRKVVEASKLLTETGYYVATGGGPGIMEAGNLGAWLAGSSDAEMEKAMQILSAAPHYQDPGYFEAAHQVLKEFPEGAESLAIPTWFYGHEPSNVFATHIAKYFSNSIREDTLLAVSLHGVIFAPGSAGTTQEIFMDATQNHYGTFNYYSPMIFLGTKRYEIDTLIFPLLKQLSYGHPYHDMMHLTDDPGSALEFLQAHPPVIIS